MSAKGRRFDPESLLAAPQRRITDLEVQRSSREAPWDGEHLSGSSEGAFILL